MTLGKIGFIDHFFTEFLLLIAKEALPSADSILVVLVCSFLHTYLFDDVSLLVYVPFLLLHY